MLPCVDWNNFHIGRIYRNVKNDSDMEYQGKVEKREKGDEVMRSKDFIEVSSTLINRVSATN